nr:hypothetical protein [Kofleriaceae bacterium]
MLTGSVGSTADAIAVRAVTGTTVVAAAQIASDGTFTLEVPAGSYRLEMLTASGVKPVVISKNGALEQLAFRVCQPGGPWGMGSIGAGGGGSAGDSSGIDDPPPGCNNADGTPGSDCGPPQPPGGCDSSGAGSACPPPPYGGGSGGDGGSGVGIGSGGGGSAGSGACFDAAGNPCPPPPPPCSDPGDPTTCQDPCMADPTSCGCGSGDADCWPAPDPGGSCDGGMTPTNPPGDIGCGSDASSGGSDDPPPPPHGGGGHGSGGAGPGSD